MGSVAGDMKSLGLAQTYTLTSEKVLLSRKNLGSADMHLLTAWLTTPAGAGVTSLAIESSRIGDEAMLGLLEALKGVSLASLDISGNMYVLSSDCV